MKVLFDSLKNLWVNMKVAAKDKVDLLMFLFFAVLSFLDITETFYQIGTIGFMTFYLFFCLIRLATLKRELEKLNSKKLET